MKTYQISKSRRIIVFDNEDIAMINNPETPDSKLLALASGLVLTSKEISLLAKNALAQRIKNEIKEGDK